MTKRSIEALQDKELKILPISFERDWYKCFEDTHDWCISRQLQWGHRVSSYFVSSDDISIGNETDIIIGLVLIHMKKHVIKLQKDLKF
jgi:valyl-tRNA synthetase